MSKVLFVYPEKGEKVRKAVVFHYTPPRAFIDYSMGYVEYETRWLRSSTVQQKLINGKWKTFEFLD